VSVAFILGWRLAELYDLDTIPARSSTTTPAPTPDHLPGASEMTEHDRARVLVDQADNAMLSLTDFLGDRSPTLDNVRQVMGQPGPLRDLVRAEVAPLYTDLQARLAASATRLATALGLGRMLADTIWLPRSDQPGLYLERFAAYRLSNAYGWLDDLDEAFPRRAAAAVVASLTAWERWVRGATKSDGSPDVTQLGQSALRALRRQGELWRRLLGGEKDPMQLLGPADYVAAASRLVSRGRQITTRFLWKWLPGAVLLVVAAAAAVWAAVTYAPAGTDRVVAVLVSLVGTLGVSWKGVEATLGRALRQAEAALWAAEVDAAVGQAATIVPDERAGQPPAAQRRRSRPGGSS